MVQVSEATAFDLCLLNVIEIKKNEIIMFTKWDSVFSFILRTSFDADSHVFEKKPWRDPGTDINDFFNYGFNEKSWKDYCKPLVSKTCFDSVMACLVLILISFSPFEFKREEQ